MADTALEGESRKLGRYRLIPSGLVLSALSFTILVYMASEEPFLAFRPSDCLLICGVGGLVCVLFVVWAVACVRHLRRTPRPRGIIALYATACVLWTVINLFYLGTMISGYRDDLNNPRLHHLR